ncbi:MAG: PEGA domain-containing protein [Kofleriaceae bacterium]
MRAKSEIDTEEVLRSRALESVDDLDCPTPIAIPVVQRFAVGSQGVETRIVDEAQMHAAARASVAAITVTREVSEPAMRRAARASMSRAAQPSEILGDAFEVEPSTDIDARDSFEQVSTIEKNTAAVDRVTTVDARSYDWLRARVSRAKARGSVPTALAHPPVARVEKSTESLRPLPRTQAADDASCPVAGAQSRSSVVRTTPVVRATPEHDEHSPEPVLLVARKPRGSMAPRVLPVVEAQERVEPRPQVRAQVDVVAPLPRIDPAVVRPRIAPRDNAPRAHAEVAPPMHIDVVPPMRNEFAPIPSLVARRPVPSAPTLSRRVTRWLAGCALIAMVGAVAMGATYLLARDMQRQATGPAPAAAAAPVVSETRTLPVIAAPTSGTLRFTVEPVDAKIRIDKVVYASSSIDLPLGRHEVRVSRRGYASWRRTIEVTATTTDVFVVLAHAPKRRARPAPRAPIVEPIAEPTVTPIAEPTVTPIIEGPQASDDEDPLKVMMSASTRREDDR